MTIAKGMEMPKSGWERKKCEKRYNKGYFDCSRLCCFDCGYGSVGVWAFVIYMQCVIVWILCRFSIADAHPSC